MRSRFLFTLPLLLAVVTAAGAAPDAPAAQPLPAGRHGGTVTATAGHAFETALAADGVRIFLLTDEGAPAMVEKATGTVQLELPDGRTLQLALVRREPTGTEAVTYFCPMHAEVVRDKPGTCDLCGGMTLFAQDVLFGAADLTGVAPEAVGLMVRLSGLRGPEKDVTFSPAFPMPDTKAAASRSGT